MVERKPRDALRGLSLTFSGRWSWPHLNHIGVVRGLMQINHRLDQAGHASVGTQNLRSTTERSLPCVRNM
jgi:hypothetical protein